MLVYEVEDQTVEPLSQPKAVGFFVVVLYFLQRHQVISYTEGRHVPSACLQTWG